jgi:drug/metabolite transporter (DMT)-like permease
MNPLVATLVGWWLLGEALTPIQWVGGIIVLASVAVINLPGNGKGHGNGNGQSKSKTSRQ